MPKLKKKFTVKCANCKHGAGAHTGKRNPEHHGPCRMKNCKCNMFDPG